MDNITVDLWFDDNAEEAAAFYTSVFPNSRVLQTTRYGADMPGPEGAVMYVEFELDGQRFGAINGGPQFSFSPAVSLVKHCASQEEIDRYWAVLSSVPEAEACGWCQDKFGVSWQIVPNSFSALVSEADPARTERVMRAVLSMKKLDLTELERAAAAG